MILDKLSAREKKILYVTFSLLLLVFGYHGIWRPMMSRIGSMDDQIFAMQLQLRKAKTFIRQRDQVLEEAKKYANLEQMDAGTDEEEIAKLLNLIEQTARTVGVSLSDVKPQQLMSDKLLKRYVVELNAECNLNQLLDFVYQMQHSPQHLKVERVDVNQKGDQSTALHSFIIVTRVVVK